MPSLHASRTRNFTPLFIGLGLALLAPADSFAQGASRALESPPVSEFRSTQSLPAHIAQAATPKLKLRFEHLIDEHGLSQNTVSCMLQDRTGFMWFGTQDGLTRYDGYTFKIFRHEAQDTASISDNHITALYEDRAGKIWVGTQSGGLNRYDPTFETFSTYRHDPRSPASLSHNHVTAIAEDSTGLWVGTPHGLNRFSAREGGFTRFFPDSENPDGISDAEILALHVDRNGVLYIGTERGGLNRYERASGRFVHFQHAADDSKSISNNAVIKIFADREGALWLGMRQNVLNKLEWAPTSNSGAQISNRTLYPIPAFAFVEDDEGTLWIGSKGQGLFRYERAQNRFSQITHDPDDPTSLSDSSVLSACVDRAGNLWLGTNGYGLNLYSRNRKAFQHYVRTATAAQGLINRSVRAIYEDEQGRLWIGGYDGLECLERKTGKVARFQSGSRLPFSLPGNEVFVVYPDPADNGKTFLIGLESRNGLMKFDRATERFTPYPFDPAHGRSLIPHPIYTLHREQSGTLWVGTDNGLFEYDEAKKSLRHFRHEPKHPRSLGDNMVVDLFEEANGTLWIGTYGGLHRFERATGEFVRYQHEPRNFASLGSNRVKCIFASRDGTLWIGTDGGGLNRFDPAAEKFMRYTTQNGLPNDVVYAILEDDAGRLWLSTNNGLSRFDPRTLTSKNYHADDGLQGREFNTGAYFKSKSGEMFFGGINGVTAFHPEQINDNAYIPPVVLTGFSKFNQPVKLDTALAALTHLALDYTDAVFSLQFVALNFTAPEKNQYAFRLEGFHQDWIALGTKREATFTRLDPGDYVLRVRGSNNDGVWNEAGTSVKITIAPLFYQTVWFAALCVFLLGFTVYGVYHWRLHRFEKRQVELEDAVTIHTAALRISEAKLRAIFDHAPDFVVLINRAMKITFINRTAAGISREQVIGASLFDFVQPKYHAIVKERLERVWQTQVSEMIEIEAPGPNGTTAWYFTAIAPIPSDGKVEAVILMANDITAHKQMGEALRQSEERFRILYNDTPVMMHSINRAGELINVNDFWLTTMDYEREEVLGKKVYDFLTEASRQYATTVALPLFLKTGSLQNVPLQFIKKNGDVIEVQLTATSKRNEQGEVEQSYTFLVDVTEQKRALAALQESETKFRTLAETMPAGIFIFQGMKMRYTNPAAERISGYSREEIFAMNFWDVIHPEYQALVKERGLARQRGEDVSQHYEVKMITKAGEERWVDFTASRMEFEGKPAVLGAVLDVTARRQAEENIRQLNERLEQRVLERTLELEESKNRFQQIVENIHEVMWIESVEPRELLYVSPAFEKIWGYPSARLFESAEVFLTTVAPEDREQLKTHLRKQRRGELSEIEYRITRADGERRWIRDRSFPIRDEQGKVYRTAGVAADITAQKREEENRQARTVQMLKQQAALLKLTQADNTDLESAYRRLTEAGTQMLRVARTSIWLFNEERTEMICADVYNAGLARHENGARLNLSSYPRYVAALHESRILATYEDGAETPARELMEHYFKLLGTTAMMIVPIWQGEKVEGMLCCEHLGAPRHWTWEEQEFAAAIANLTALALEAAERKRMEEEVRTLNLELEQRVLARTAELRESEARFRQMAENISDVFWLDTGDLSRTLYVSPAFEEIWGSSSQRLLEHPEIWREALHPEDCERALAQAERWVNEGMKEPYQANYRIVRPDGSVRWISNQAFPIRNEAGKVYRVAGVAKDITVRTQAVEQLADTALQLQAILAALPDMYFRVAEDGTFLDYSAPRDMALYAPPELFLGRRVDEVFPADLAELFHERHLQALQTQRVAVVEYALPMPNGEHFYEGRLAPFRKKEIIALIRDVTARKHAERAVRESEERYRTLAESAHDFVFIVDRAGFVCYLNAFAASYFERTPSELIGKHGSELFSSQHYERIWASLQSVFETGKPLRLEGEVKFPRHALWLDAQLIPLHIEAGEVRTLTGVARDLTERKWAEDELSATSSRLITLMENLQSGILFEDETRHVLYVNPKFCELFGVALPPAHLIRMDWSQACEMVKGFFYNAEEFVVRVEEIIAARRLVTNEELCLQDGRTFERDAVPVFVDEKFVGQLWRYRDITKRKQLEAQLLEHTTKLEELVEVRARRIQELERQRVETEKLAATGRMAARVAHEINNPLGTVKTAFRLLSRTLSREHRHYEMVGTIEKEIDRIAKIVTQMLDLNRPWREEAHPFRADLAIREVLDLMKARALEHEVSLEADLAQAQVTVKLQENMLRQILYNTLLNAVEASPQPGVVQVAAKAVNAHLEIHLTDRGPGIPPEIATQIFEPFFTTKNRSSIGGMGLGLSISKSLIEAMNGNLTLDSKPGEGTTCRIVIPLP